MSKISGKRVLNLPTLAENKRIVVAAKADTDAKPLSKAQLQAMVPLRTLRGRPLSENKKLLLSVRYSPEVVAYFRGTGDGWQARMDGVLRDYVNRQVAPRKRQKSD